MKTCLQCGINITKLKNESKKYFAEKKYCSKKCIGLSRIGKKLSDSTIKKMRDFKHSQSVIEKRRNAIPKGINCHLWKGGITPINHKIRDSREYKLWQKSCMIRDNFTCQKYGIVGGKLNVHHINNFADFPELRLAIDNGITLCKKAHIEFHKLYGRKNNTREQLQEYLSNNLN